MSRVFFSIGTNLGQRKENIEHALKLLSEKVKIINVSSYYETEPVGYEDQPWFLNIALEGETDLSPQDLLTFTKSIEKQMKRVKTMVNGPRIIDVDILLYDSIKVETENLTIPHPRMISRAFVMVPLFEIAQDIFIDGVGIKDIMDGFKAEEVRKIP